MSYTAVLIFPGVTRLRIPPQFETSSFVSRLALSVIAISFLSACSAGTSAFIPNASGASAAHQKPGSRHDMCLSDETICVVEPPDDNEFNNCIIGCNSGYPTGSGYVGPWGAGGGCISDPDNCVSTAVPEVGDDCDGSQTHGTPIKLGTSNLPGGTNGVATSVVNIWSVQSANDYVAGWVYKTYNGNYFWEGNPNGAGALSQFAQAIPEVGPVISGFQDMVDSPRQVSQTDLNTIVKASSTGTFHEHHCFTSDLPASKLGSVSS